MNFFDVLIPLFGGIYLLTSGDKLIKTTDSSFEQKKGLIKKAGIALIAVSVIYLVVKMFCQ